MTCRGSRFKDGIEIEAEIKPTDKHYSSKTVSVSSSNLSEALEKQAEQVQIHLSILPERGQNGNFTTLFIFMLNVLLLNHKGGHLGFLHLIDIIMLDVV
jgi:hypothetical protein